MDITKKKKIEIFCCYAKEDQGLLLTFKKHLKPLERQDLITVWSDIDINAGMEWEKEIKKHLNSAQIILLFISPDFMHSDYCYSIEMMRAMDRHKYGEAHVIPIILRPIKWLGAPFGKLQALPANAEPVTSRTWYTPDDAFLNATEGIEKIVNELLAQPLTAVPLPQSASATPEQRLQTSATNSAEEEKHHRIVETERIRKVEEEKQQKAKVDKSQTFPMNQPVQSIDIGQPMITRRRLLGLTGLIGGVILLASSPHWIHLLTRVPLGTLLFTYKTPQITLPNESINIPNPVTSVTWSPDGTHIASVSFDDKVRVWDAANGTLLYSPYAVSNRACKAVAWSPDGKRIASGGDAVQVWDAADKTHPSTYRGQSSYGVNIVNTVAWSPDSLRIASGSNDGTVQVWDEANGGHPFTYQGHSSSVNTVAWSPNDLRIASGGDDETVQVWDATTGTHSFTYRGHSSSVNTVAWSPDSKRIASGSYDNTVQVWDAATGTHSFTNYGYSSSVNTVAWSPDGTHIASASSDGTVQVWDAADGTHSFTYRGHSSSVKAVAWSPDSTRIASGGNDETVQVWSSGL